MINGEEIAEKLDSGELLVVPRPPPDAVDGASVDLRLGRWFLSFRQTHTATVPLAKVPEAQPNASVLPVAPGAEEEERHVAVVVEGKRTRQSFVPFGKSYVLHPGAFVLGATLEWVRLPADISGYVTGKSSLGRHGLVIETAAGIHPTFSGCLTLELANVGEVPLQIYPGMGVCQLFLHAHRPITIDRKSSFSGRRKPVLGTPSFDPVFQRLVRGEAELDQTATDGSQ